MWQATAVAIIRLDSTSRWIKRSNRPRRSRVVGKAVERALNSRRDESSKNRSLALNAIRRLVHEHDDVRARSGLLDQFEHAWIFDVELLCVRVKLEYFDAKARNPTELVQSGLPVYGWTVAIGTIFGCVDASVINASFCARVCSVSPCSAWWGPPNHMPPNAVICRFADATWASYSSIDNAPLRK